MFKIESYITSIILANADRYIRNFRKEDAQVPLELFSVYPYLILERQNHL